jgi:hypothetical protein
MKSISRIKFNPTTKEIEVEGSEQFVKQYFGKLQAMLSGATGMKAAIKKAPKSAKAVPVKLNKQKSKAANAHPKKMALKVAIKKPSKKRATKMASVIEVIQGSSEGISTAELKEKTGLGEIQIWNIVNRAAKDGKIRKIKRGLYGS